MTNKDEPLMKMGAPTTEEKLLWERHANKHLVEELKQTKMELGIVKSEFEEYKDEIKNNTNAQMLNKLNNIKLQKQNLEFKINQLKKDNENLLLKVIEFQKIK